MYKFLLTSSLVLVLSLALLNIVEGQQTSTQNINLQAMNQGLFNGIPATVLIDTFRMFGDNGGDLSFYAPINIHSTCLPQNALSTINTAITSINSVLALLNLDPVDHLSDACFGPDMKVKFGIDMDLYFRTLISSGDVDINYPFQSTITYPDFGSTGCNDFMVFQTSTSPLPGYTMSIQEPEMEFALGVQMKPGFYLDGKICAGNCIDISDPIETPSGFSTATPSNYKTKLGGGDFDLLGFSTSGGLQFPWDYSSLIPKPSGIPSLTLPLNTNLIPGDPIGNFAKIHGTLDNPFRDLDLAPDIIIGKSISSTINNEFINISIDPLQFQEYLTGVPLTFSRSLGAGINLNLTVVSVPFIVADTQRHEFKFDFTELTVNFNLSTNVTQWREVTPAGDTIRTGYNTNVINNFTMGNKLLIKSNGAVTVTPSYTINSNTFMSKIFQELQFSLNVRILDLNMTFPAINSGSVCNDIVAGLQIPDVMINDLFHPTQWCDCLPFGDPDRDPMQPFFCIDQWACEFAQISLEQIVADACAEVVNIANSGLIQIGPLVNETFPLGDPIPLPPITDATFPLTFNPFTGTSLMTSPNVNPPVVNFITDFIWTPGTTLNITAANVITPISGVTPSFDAPTPAILTYDDCSKLYPRPVIVRINNNCTEQSYPVTINVTETIPPGCASVRTDTLNVEAGQYLNVSNFWTGPTDLCTISFLNSSLSPNVFTCASEGVQTVNLTLIDKFGNTSICTAKVNVFGPAQIYYVNSNATGSANGLTWDNAFTTLQDALAVSCTGTTIYVAEGTYYPTDGTDQTIPFLLNKSINLYGGFSPSNGITTPGQQDWNTYPTILSGDIDQDGLLDAENSQTVIYATGDVLVEGFIIEQGNADGDQFGPLLPKAGGGLMNTSNSQFTNCIFRNNSALAGGAVYCQLGNPTFTNCIIYDNLASLSSAAVSPSSGSPMFINCTIVDNVSPAATMYINTANVTLTNCIFWNNGVDLACFGVGHASVMTSLLHDGGLPACGVNLGGNIYNQDPLFEDVMTHNYRITQFSPALNTGTNSGTTATRDFDQKNRIFQNVVDMGAYEYQCPPSAIPTSYTVTTAVDNAPGSLKNLVEQFACTSDTIYFAPALNGVVQTISGEITMTKNLVIIGNGYQNTIVDGGNVNRLFHIYNTANVEMNKMTLRNGYTSEVNPYLTSQTISKGGAILLEGNLTLKYCVLSGNEAYWGGDGVDQSFGGAIYVRSGSLTTNNCLLSGNTAGAGGAIYSTGTGTITTYSTTIAGNLAHIYARGGGINKSGASLIMYNTIVSGNKDLYHDNVFGEYSGSGNKIGGASFVAPVTPGLSLLGNYQLTVDESSIDKGTDSVVTENADLLGNVRILNGHVDPGAYEKVGCGLSAYNLYVDQTASPGGDGLLWTTAFTDLDDALDVLNGINCTVNIDTIFVAQGTYKSPGSGFVSNYYYVNRPVAIIGGYPNGGGTRDWTAHQTILNGATPNPSFLRYTVLETNSDLTLDGFIIEKGSAIGSYFPANPALDFYYRGGGIINRGNSTFRNCIFRNNNALYGGALYSYSGELLIENCIFYNNTAFHPERTDDNGSAIYVLDGNAKILNCTFDRNPGDVANAVMYFAKGTHQVLNSIVWDDELLMSVNEEAALTANNNLFHMQDYSGIIMTNGSNVYTDEPLFVNQYSRDYNLLPCSAAVDAGDDTVLGDLALDFAENNRAFGTVDIGAFELQNNSTTKVNKVYVDASVIISGDGASWATAFKTLIEAMDPSATCGVDSILVAEGTYKPTSGADRSIAHINYSPLVILGGYPVQGLGTRDWSAHPTIISGDINDNDVADAGDSYTLFLNYGGLELNGLILEKSFADGVSTFEANGGGVFSFGAIKIYNSVIRDNHAPANLGGGIYHTGSAFEMINSTVFGNSGERLGAAIHMDGTGTFSITNCTIANNISDTDAAGVVYTSTTQIGTIRNSILVNPNEGEIRNVNSITLANTIIEDGKPASVVDGGGVLASDPAFTDISTNDFTLRPCSPAIDKGVSAFDNFTFNRDINGAVRPQSVAPDMGAYEYQGSPNLDDILHVNIYVDKNATPGGTGYSWASAYTELMDGFNHENNAKNCENVDTIFVAEGYYTPTSGTDRTLRFILNTDKDLVIIGGYPSGGGISDYTLHPTIMTGEIGAATNTDNSYKVLTNLGTLELNGFTIEKSYTDNLNLGSEYQNGHGILNAAGANLTMNYCDVRSHYMGTSAFYGGYGAGVYSSGTLTINNSKIRDNAANGETCGGLALGGGVAVLNNVLIRGNTGAVTGGAIYTHNTQLTLRNCSIFDNSTSNDSNDGIYVLANSGSTQIINTILWNPAGGEFNSIGSVSSVSVKNSIVRGTLPPTIVNLGGNLSSDPLVVGGGDYSLTSCSPAINSGDNGEISNLPALDLAMQVRVYENIIDMGAYEFQSGSFVETNISVALCESDSIFLAGAWQDTSGSYLDIIPAVLCSDPDTMLTTVVSILPTARNSIATGVCQKANVSIVMDTIFGGAANGCDTITTFNNYYIPPISEYIYTLVCDIANVGVVYDTLFGGAINGCDSARIMIGAVRRLYPPLDVFIPCGDSILIAGVYRSAPGVYEEIVQTGMGCDSIVTKKLQYSNTDHYYVDHSASGLENGFDWPNAFTDLQSALFNTCLKTGDTIYVAEGMYYPDQGGGMIDNNRNAHFIIPDGITVKGGYPQGGGPQDLSAYATILSGDLEQNDLSQSPATIADIVGANAYTVVMTNGGTLDGVSITAGYSDAIESFPGMKQRGAGIFNIGNSKITNCIVTGNFAVTSGTPSEGEGAGIFHLNGDAEYVNCLIVRNYAGAQGGGINCAFGNPKLINCTIALNSDGGVEGGIGGTNANVTMENSILWGNDDQMAILGTGSIHFSHNLVEETIPYGVSNISDLGGNVADDPYFIDTTNNNFHVDPCLSPANDGGNSLVVTQPVDLDQHTRIQGSAVDIGVYENNPNLSLLVTTTANAGLGSLRAALSSACANGVVEFDPALATQTIHLTGPEIILSRNVKILGLGMDNLFISGENNSRVFTIPPGKLVHIESLNLINGHPIDGLILNQGTLEINNVRVQN